MDDTPSERSLRDLLCGIREDERSKRNVFLMQVVGDTGQYSHSALEVLL